MIMIEQNDDNFEQDKRIACDIISGNTGALSQYLKEGWDINRPLLIDEEGYRYRYILPIMLAIYKCNVDSIHYLVEHKAKLDVGNEHAFLYAVRYTDGEIIEYLIQNKAKVNVFSHVHTNAYSEAYMGNRYEYFRLIQEFGLSANLHGRDTINLAICQNNDEALDKLLELTVDLNNNIKTKNNIYGDTSLIYGVRYGDKSMIEKLLNHGADPNYPNLLGKTPYTLALEQNKQDIITLFEPMRKNKIKINDLTSFKMPRNMVEFLTNNTRIQLPIQSTVPYIEFLPLSEVRETLLNNKKRYVISSNVGDFPSIHLLWNPCQQCIAYYEDEHMEYGDLCSFSKFMKEPAKWLDGILKL